VLKHEIVHQDLVTVTIGCPGRDTNCHEVRFELATTSSPETFRPVTYGLLK
jgi:hypothetical protein